MNTTNARNSDLSRNLALCGLTARDRDQGGCGPRARSSRRHRLDGRVDWPWQPRISASTSPHVFLSSHDGPSHQKRVARESAPASGRLSSSGTVFVWRCSMLNTRNPEPYRELAEECRRLAASAPSRQIKNRYLLMAQDYLWLADLKEQSRTG